VFARSVSNGRHDDRSRDWVGLEIAIKGLRFNLFSDNGTGLFGRARIHGDEINRCGLTEKNNTLFRVK